jgi:hypothetical protein
VSVTKKVEHRKKTRNDRQHVQRPPGDPEDRLPLHQHIPEEKRRQEGAEAVYQE